ncbi:hypothetical protein ACFQ5D_20775 [Paenibacillus farraposensis]|uniref:Uncharacterized protein n=2 Tax=Paenibacillus farraposensis TaxID=2807095 RepID=A0ABW4DGM6_9BACL
MVSPDGYALAIAYMSRPGNDEKQLDLIYDYQTNVKMYPQFRQYLQERQPPFLAAWGKNDVLSIPEGAKAFKKRIYPMRKFIYWTQDTLPWKHMLRK